MIASLLNIDNFLTDFIFHLSHPFPLIIIFQLISMIGNFYVIAAFILLIYIAFIERKKKITKNQWIIPFVIVIIISWITSEFIIKNIVQRPRPYIISLISIADQISGYSFPSAHTTVAFAAAFVLSVSDKKRGKIFYTIAVLIAFSRVYLGYHYLSDVITGAVLGMGIGYLVLKISIYKTNSLKLKCNNHNLNLKT